MKDPLALWRTKDPLSLIEAGALILDVPPSRTWPTRPGDLNQAQREERDAVTAARAEILAAAKGGRLPANLKYKREGGGKRSDNFVTRWNGDSPESRFEPYSDVLVASESTVARADLEAWCSARGLRPAVFAPSPPDPPLAESDTGALPDYVADKVSALRFAWRKHWANATPKDGATWPKREAVEQTLKQRGIGSDRICAAVATMIHPPWAKGRPPTGEK